MQQKFFIIFAWLILCLSFGQILISLTKIYTNQNLIDFSSYYQAAQAFKSQQNPYLIGYDGDVKFIYPPSSLLFFYPFSFLSPKNAEVVFLCISIGLFIASLFLVLKQNSKLSPAWKIIIIALLLQTFPVKLTFGLGQINSIVLFGVVGALYCLKKNRPVASSLLLTLATNLKIIPIALLPIFLIKKQYKLVGLWLFFIVISNVIFPKLSTSYFSTTLAPMITNQRLFPSFYDQSISAFFYRITGEGVVSAGMSLVLVLAFYFFILWKSKKQSIETAAFIMFALLSISLSPSWQHYLIWSYPFIIQHFSNPHYFLFIWLGLLFHFSHENQAPLDIMESYQGLLIFGLIILSFGRDALRRGTNSSDRQYLAERTKRVEV